MQMCCPLHINQLVSAHDLIVHAQLHTTLRPCEALSTNFSCVLVVAQACMMQSCHRSWLHASAGTGMPLDHQPLQSKKRCISVSVLCLKCPTHEPCTYMLAMLSSVVSEREEPQRRSLRYVRLRAGQLLLSQPLCECQAAATICTRDASVACPCPLASTPPDPSNSRHLCSTGLPNCFIQPGGGEVPFCSARNRAVMPCASPMFTYCPRSGSCSSSTSTLTAPACPARAARCSAVLQHRTIFEATHRAFPLATQHALHSDALSCSAQRRQPGVDTAAAGLVQVTRCVQQPYPERVANEGLSTVHTEMPMHGGTYKAARASKE